MIVDDDFSSGIYALDEYDVKIQSTTYIERLAMFVFSQAVPVHGTEILHCWRNGEDVFNIIRRS